MMRQRFLDSQGSGYSNVQAMQELLRVLRRTQTNEEFLNLFVRMAELDAS
ncbi:MAG: hypothetical protein GX601_08630 [Anaerolineales bacterium]|nr:hypothetical protein [Anaerolineales bacterium]